MSQKEIWTEIDGLAVALLLGKDTPFVSTTVNLFLSLGPNRSTFLLKFHAKFTWRSISVKIFDNDYLPFALVYCGGEIKQVLLLPV